MTSREVEELAREVGREFPGEAYDLVKRNCNSFADAFCERLLGHGIPGWVNRLSYFGASLDHRFDVLGRKTHPEHGSSSPFWSSQAVGLRV